MTTYKTILTTAALTLLTTLVQGQIPTVGTAVQGDFNGDGKKEYAFAVQTKQSEGNPMDGGIPGEYAVNFSTDKLKSIIIGCCEATIINEGDLNGDGRDEISVFQAPMNGNTFSMTTYSYVNGAWKITIETFLIPTAGDYLSDESLQKRIFKENNSVYFYDVDVNDENFRLVKKKARLK